MFSLCMNKLNVSHPMITKINALRIALELCTKLDFSRALFERDAQIVIHAMIIRHDMGS